MIQAKNWPIEVMNIWAKSPVRNQAEGESLPEHTLHTLQALHNLIKERIWLGPEVCCIRLWHALFWAAFLHDFGKAAQGFQEQLRHNRHWGHRHEVLSLAFIDWLSSCITTEEDLAITAAIVSHHRDATDIHYLYRPIEADNDSVEKLVAGILPQDVLALYNWLKTCSLSWIEHFGMDQLGVQTPPFCASNEEVIRNWNQKATSSVRRRLANYRRLVKEIEAGINSEWSRLGIIMRGILVQADHLASAHYSQRPVLNIQKDTFLTNMLPGKKLYSHQMKAQQAVNSAILLAPTGAGKTEAAILWSAEQLKSRGASRMYYTLPYQASMNAMFDRLNTLFPGKVGLLHGRSLLALYWRLMSEGSNPCLAEQLAYTAHNLARLRHQPIQVLSPYQLLKVAYRLKGYEAMLIDLTGALFVFDEIHAYEPQRLAMIIEFIRYLHSKWRASFFIMSATLPKPIITRLESALDQPTIIKADRKLLKSFQRHKLHIIPGELVDDEALGKILDSFKAGKSVLVVANTVSRAQYLYQSLSRAVPPESIFLLHGRFTTCDRLAKEQHILTATGLNSRTCKPIIVVSTQVVEVSLNIDLDTIYTDPAPLEALLQRFGRVNRNRRMPIAPVHVFTQPQDGQNVYLPDLVKATMAVLEKHHKQPVCEEEIEQWLEEIYTGTVLTSWDDEYERVADIWREVVINDLYPFKGDNAMQEQFDKLFDSVEVLPESLLDKYIAHKENAPLTAYQFLVPISWRRLHSLRKTGHVSTDSNTWPPVVELPYSSEFGLNFK